MAREKNAAVERMSRSGMRSPAEGIALAVRLIERWDVGQSMEQV